MKQILLILTFCCAYTFSFSQKGSIKGVLTDTTSHQPVGSATLTLLKKSDSSLVSFTMADESGRFELTGIATGDYRLLITHTNYHNKNVLVSVHADNPQANLNAVIMHDKTTMMQEIVITSEVAPVSLIGDTIEYNAGSFKTVPNANVEDLLKKLPGVRVDKDGTVKAQGEKVQRVLVDGKEFFGSDPKMATKNLPADAIDKVQVYDRMSDQAQMTGFDDGTSEKTINLKLKKDKKKGMFGKATAGYGTDERYEGRFNLNSFKGARQMSVLAMGNNTNAEGFSFMDLLSFSGALNQMKNGNGNMSISIGADDPLAGMLGNNNSGINTTRAGGINYNNIIGNKTDWQSNYFFSHYNPYRVSESKRQYFSPSFLSDQATVSDNIANTHKLNFSADHQIDSFHSVKLTSSIGYQDTRNTSLLHYLSSSENKKINEGTNNSINEKNGSTLSSSVLFRKKFQRKGRTFSLNLSGNFNKSEGDGSLQSSSGLYDDNGYLFRKDQILQQNINSNDLTAKGIRAVYTEPLFRRSLLEFSAGRNISTSISSKTTFDYDPADNKYDLVNDALSNNFENTYGYTTAGLRLRKKNKKLMYSLGANWQNAELSGTNKNLKDSSIRREYTDVLPNASVQYNISRSKNLRLNYTGYTTQPTITQLQPVVDNNNPLYISVGNPYLQQEYTHSLRLNASFINPFKNRNLFVQLAVQQTKNKIVNSERINRLGVDSIMPVNVDGVYNVNGTVSFSLPIKPIKGSVEISSNIGKSHSMQLLNDRENILNTFTAGPQLTLYVSPTDDLDFSVGASYNYSRTTYSLVNLPVKFLQQEYNIDLNWQLPGKFLLSTDFRYRITDNDAASFHTKVPLWNASISKQFLAVNRGQLRLSVNDMLNKNVLISRTANPSYIEDRSVSGLKRFAMLSFTYNLTKTGLGSPKGGGGVRVMR